LESRVIIMFLPRRPLCTHVRHTIITMHTKEHGMTYFVKNDILDKKKKLYSKV